MPKANLMIIRGKLAGRWSANPLRDWRPLPKHPEWANVREAEFVSESFTRLQHRAFTELVPLRVGDRGDSIFQLTLLVCGKPPIRTEVEFQRGCNGLSMAPDIAALIPPEFHDPIHAIKYAAEHGLETPPYVDLKTYEEKI